MEQLVVLKQQRTDRFYQETLHRGYENIDFAGDFGPEKEKILKSG